VTGIRHIAPAATTDRLFLTAEFEHRVRLWSFADHSLTAELDTVLDFGGQRLALCGAETPIVVAGAWERHGICGYAPDGTRLWQRKDLRQPQHISPAAGGALVVACFDQRPLHVLDAVSGETRATVRAVGATTTARSPRSALARCTGTLSSLAQTTGRFAGGRLSMASPASRPQPHLARSRWATS
jgi:hypothetical protein